jgi:NAD(P)-dependent dehydrogenase (short-subunit alcohol dehydrogenase family)
MRTGISCSTSTSVTWLGPFEQGCAWFLAQGRGGTIVSVGSGYAGSPMQAASGAAKAGLASLARSVAAEYSREGIRMNLVSCGPIATRRSGRPDRYSGVDSDGPSG